MAEHDGPYGRSRIALIRSGDRPRINGRLQGLLTATFPDHRVDDIDVLTLTRRRPDRFVAAAATGAAENIVPLLARRIRPKRAFVTSSGFARSVHSIVTKRVTPATHAFTFQSQSLFPVAVPGVPNFVYTDNTHINDISFPGFDQRTVVGGRVLRREIVTFRSAAMVFTRSTNVRDTLVHGYGFPPDRVAVVGVGPNVEVVPRAVDQWSGGRIVFVGVDWERKGGPQLLAAFRRLHETYESSQLDIIGCAPPGVGGAGITVHGRLDGDAVAGLLAAADVFCLPTRAEPFGVAFVEAMLAGLPIVGTSIGAVPELVVDGQTGRLVPADDVEALHDALADLIARPQAALGMGARGRERALAHYQWDIVMVAIARHVNAIVGTKPAAPAETAANDVRRLNAV
jgi:glycosyltransferase involved in cell wall biosynthesis